MFKRKTIFFAFCCCFFATVMFAQQTKTVCFGAIKSYFVDLDDGPKGTIGSIYDWTILEPNSAKITGNGTNSVSIDWATTAPGNYTVQVLETNENCMSSTSILPIRVKANPVITAQGSIVCEGFSGLIAASATPINPAFQYNWTFPSGAIDPGNVASFETSIGGEYVVTVKDNHGCISNPATATLVVNSLPSATLVAEGPTRFCEGGSLVLSAPTGMSSYIWSKDGVIIEEETLSDRLLTTVSSGNYAVTIIDNKGCSSTTDNAIFVDVKPLPVIDVLLSGPAEFCYGNSISLTASAAGNGLTYQWLDKGVEIANQVESIFIASTTSNYSVKVVDENGCGSTSGVVDVVVRSNPDATITHNTPTTFCAGDSVSLSVAMVAGYSYQWSDYKGPIFGATNPTYLASETSNYTIQVIDTNFPTFCTSTAMLPVKVVKKVLPVVSTIVGD
jgi:hypothetical protein